MSLKAKALEMRNAIDGIELALNGIDHWNELIALWQGAREDLVVKIDIEVGSLRQIREAMEECTRIINSEDFTPANLGR